MHTLLKTIINIGFITGWSINALLFVPQAIKIFKSKSTQGTSLITFLGFNLIQLFTILHGLQNQDYKLAIVTSFSFITCGAVTLLLICYRNKL